MPRESTICVLKWREFYLHMAFSGYGEAGGMSGREIGSSFKEISSVTGISGFFSW